MVYQSYSAYKKVSQRGYRVITIQEGKHQSTPQQPLLFEHMQCDVDLTIVVPCYNESKRFPRTFDETYNYIAGLKKRKNIVVEMVLVNDGSKDST